jgi:hypothetical protein
MALAFTATKGKAVKNSHESYTYKDGENTVRIVGGILPRYVYWLKGSNNKDIPVECLAFDREKEKFTNAEVDHVPAFFPDKKCSWSYSVNALVDGKVVVLNLKKKLFEQICSAAEDLGDPTDPKEGWDVVFKRQKTGPLPFNVEYTLSVLRCKKRALTTAELAAVAESITIDAKFVRATPAEVLVTLERISAGGEEEVAEGVDAEAVSDLSA